MESAYELKGNPKLLIVDGAGILFDPRSVVPAYALQAAFEEKGIIVEFNTVMKYMGRQKQEHIRLLLKEEEVLKEFQQKYGREPNEDDVTAFYTTFKNQLYPSASKTKEIDGVKDAAYKLKKAGIPLIMTTGYDRRMVYETIKRLPWLNEVLEYSVTSSDVENGRPSPSMLYRSMDLMGLEFGDFSYVVNVGDTKVDVESSDNAVMPGILVLSGSITDETKAEEINRELGRKH